MKARILKRGVIFGIVGLSLSAIVALILFYLGFLANDESENSRVGIAEFVSLIVISPILETGMMVLLLRIVKWLSDGQWVWGLVAIIMALLHSLLYPVWGLIVLAPFMIYAHLLSDVEESRADRFWTVFVAHLTSNSLVFALLMLVQSHN